jgi:hypothetical protein
MLFRYINSMEDVIKKIYTQMEFYFFTTTLTTQILYSAASRKTPRSTGAVPTAASSQQRETDQHNELMVRAQGKSPVHRCGSIDALKETAATIPEQRQSSGPSLHPRCYYAYRF